MEISDLRLAIAVCLLTFALASFFLPTNARSQGSLSVQREFVLSTSGLGVGNAVIELRDGGFAAVGYADSGGPTGTDIVLIRFDTAGDTLWTRWYGGESEDLGWDVVEAPDGGLFIVGYTEAPTAGREDVLVLRVDESGELLWERKLGGAGRDRAWSAALALDGDIVIAAESEDVERGGRDARLVRMSGDGEVRWDVAVEAAGDQRVYSVARSSDNAFVSTGTTAEPGEADRDVYVVRVTGDGNLEWTRSLGGEMDDVGHGVLGLTGGDILVTGYDATHSNGDRDIYLMQLDRAGDVLWWRHDERPGEDRAMMSSRSPDGYVTVGFSMASTGFDMVVLENDTDGYVRARTILERDGSDRGVMVLAQRSRGYVLTGTVGGSSSSTGDLVVLWLGRN